MAQTRTRKSCRGMTLVELLMVISVMTILMAVAIPMVRPAFQDRILREAARQVNIFLTGAQTRAAESGRPVGVWLDVVGNTDQKYCVRMSIAEVAPGFTGATTGARCTVDGSNGLLRFWWEPSGAGNGQAIDVDTATMLDQLTPLPNENEFFIRFDHKGPLYTCANNGGGVFNMTVSGGMVPRGTEDPGSGVTTIPAGSRPVGQSFEIIRGPSKSAVSPLTLPGDAVIDMTVSGVGVGTTANVFDLASPGGQVIIMFTPSGQTGAVYVDTQEYVIGASVYLLVGRRSKVVSAAQAAMVDDPLVSNLADAANLWVTVNNRTGAITTEDTNATAPAATVLERIKDAREFARGSRQKGGR